MASADVPRRLVVTLAALILGSLVAATVQASLLRGFPLPELRRRATVIAEGRVASTGAFQQGGGIETETVLRIERAWKGEPPASVRVLTPGGTADGRRLRVAGVPRFEVGERVVVFLYRDGDAFRPVGMFQGVWRVDPQAPALARASRARGAALLVTETEPAVARGEAPIFELVGAPMPRLENVREREIGGRQ